MKAKRQPPSFDVGEGFRTHVGTVRAVNDDAVRQPDGRRRRGRLLFGKERPNYAA